MKHLRKFEKYRTTKRKEEIIKESVLQVNDIYKVRTMIDLPQSLINAYVKKVKDTTGKNVRQFFGDVDIAEEIVKFINTNFLNVDQIPAGALTGDAQGAQPGQPGAPGQAQMGAQGMPGQGPAQGQAPAQMGAQGQPGPAQGQVQAPAQGQVQGGQVQGQPAQGQPGPAPQGQAQPGPAQGQGGQVQVQTQTAGQPAQNDEDFEDVQDEEDENEEELPI